MPLNPLLAIDFYKVDHRRQYPEGTTEIYSNFTPRFVKPCNSFAEDFDNQVVVFGIQYLVQYILSYSFKAGFFKRDKSVVVSEYKSLIETALNIDDFDCTHLEDLHDLGYLPIRVKAMPEGVQVPVGVPVLTIVNTHPNFFWLTNYLETIISATLWKPITCATIAFQFKKLLTHYARATGAPQAFVPYQAHDFSFRGMSGWADAAICGAAHLTSFEGTDCVPAIDLLKRHYNAPKIPGSSVPASEHSVMCCDGSEGEFDTIKRLITEVYPDNIVSIVADSYDLWRTLTVYLPSLYKEINERQGKLVIRPDSGDPVDIICGNPNSQVDSPEYKGALQLLWETFGGRVNEAGFKELSPRVGLIYGDAITLQRASSILRIMSEKGFASSNVVFGIGSYTYQYITRDTLGFAMKATSAVINGKRKAIFKDPKTGDGGKRSAKGLLQVEVDMETGLFVLKEDVTQDMEQDGYLQTVFENGKILHETDIADIKDILDIELEAYLD